MSNAARRGPRALAIAVTASCFALTAASAADAAVKDWDGDGALAPADCRPLDPAVHPKAVDKPDLAFEDTNCDGIDGDTAKAIFVDGGAGLDARTGTREFPKKTIANALAAAKAAGKDVYVAAGTYGESLALEANVGLYGGYVPSFAARSTTESTVVSGGPQAALADGDTGVVLQLLTFQGAAAGPGGSSYGLRVVNNAKVALQRVTAVGGSAGAGGAGSAGKNGDAGGNGNPGNGGGCNTSQAAATGGGSAGGMAGGGGGAGGTSAGGGSNGVEGAGTAGGARGLAGGGATGGGNQRGGNGTDGTTGGSGTSGGNGAAVTFTADLAGGAGWIGRSGNDGAIGTAGSGGGGGGGGGAAWNGIYNAAGGSGGSGGAGGGGATPGGGGAWGGGSFGVYVFNASLVSRDSTLRGGAGGTGGNGGTGGTGGSGGSGRSGGSGGSNCGTPGVYSNGGNGGSGGAGGKGGEGGLGSGGAGGPSAGVLRSGAGSSFSPGTTTTLQGGTAGQGGRLGGTGALSAAGVSGGTLTGASAGAAVGDFDGDGIIDSADACPTIAAAAGCAVRPTALADTDGDTVPDAQDACPTVAANGADTNEDGCTDVAPTPEPTQPGPDPTPAPAVVVAASAGVDGDGDGFFAGQDCNDASAAIRPGAMEIRGNRVDENCDGVAEPLPTIGNGVVTKWAVKGNAFTLTALQITQVFPAGWHVQVRCSGRPKCSFKTKRLKAGKPAGGASSMLGSLTKRHRKFRAGQTLEVWISAPGFNTKVARLVLRKGKIPTTEVLCAAAGQTAAQKTCS